MLRSLFGSSNQSGSQAGSSPGEKGQETTNNTSIESVAVGFPAQEILEQAADGLLVVRPDGRIFFANTAAARLLQADKTALEAGQLTSVLPGIGGLDALCGQVAVVPLKDVTLQITTARLALPGEGDCFSVSLRDITALQAEQEILTQTVGQCLDAIVTIDEKNQVTFYNEAAERLWGYKADEVVGKNVKMLVPADIQANHDSYVDTNRRTKQDKIVGTSREVPIHRKDGSVIWGSLSLSRIVLQDGRLFYSAFVKDITEERDQRETINQTLEQALDAVVTIDEHNNVTFFNKAAEQLWGYARDEVIGKNVKMLVPREIQPQHDTYVNSNRKGGEDKIVGTSREVPVHRKDGSVVWGSLSLSRVALDSGKRVYTAFVKDISEERANREIIDQTLEQALDAVVTIDENNNVTFFNAAAERLWGYNRTEVVGQNVKMLVPHDIQANHDHYVNKNRHTKQDKIVGTTREVPIFRKDGSRLWGSLSLSRIELSDGRILYTAFVKDVTEAVAQREQFKILSLVANETDNSVVITDASRRIEYVNQGFEKLTGYSLQEVKGRSPGEVLQGKHTDPATVSRIRDRLTRQQPFYEEILNYDKNGTPYWISLAINPVFDENGQLERFISIQANVTETKTKALEFTTKLNTISESSAIAEWNAQGTLTEVNKFMQEAMGGVTALSQDKYLLANLLESEEVAALKEGKNIDKTFTWPDTEQEMILEGTFSSIRDMDGAVIKILMFGVNATTRFQTVAETNRVVEDVLRSSRAIAKCVADIQNIAATTQMLSLNATVEATRAGDAGKGFAVVAGEVRELSNRTSKTIKEINGITKKSEEQVSELAEFMKKLTD